METIYFNLVKSSLLRFAQAIHDRTVSENTGMGGFFRNTKLSNAKKITINGFIQEIYKLKPDCTDAELKAKLEGLIYDYEDELLKICLLKYDKNEGVTESAMDSLFALITRPYIFLNRQGLIDSNMESVKGDTPTAVLAYFCSRYKVEHMIDHIMGRFGFSESSSGHPKLSRQKEDLFVDGLTKCLRNISGLNQELDDYPSRVRDLVLDAIKSMRSELTKLCSESTIGTKTSVLSLSVIGSVDVASSYTPDEGTMKDYLIAADDMIKNSTGLKEALSTKPSSTALNTL